MLLNAFSGVTILKEQQAPVKEPQAEEAKPPAKGSAIAPASINPMVLDLPPLMGTLHNYSKPEAVLEHFTLEIVYIHNF